MSVAPPTAQKKLVGQHPLPVIDTLYTTLLALITWLSRITIAVSIILVLIEVISRWIFHTSIAWSEEIALDLFVLTVFLSIPLSFHKHNQPSMDMLKAIHPRVDDLLTGFSYGVVGAYFVTIFIYWFPLIPAESAQVIPGVGLSLLTMGLILPFSIAMAFIVLAVQAVRVLLSRKHLWLPFCGGIALGIAATFWLLEIFTVSTAMPGLIIVVVLILLGTPIAVSLGVGAMAMVASTGISTLDIITQTLLQAPYSFVLLAIPFFLVTGAIVAETSLGPRIVDFAKSWLGWLPGGLGVADVIASALFANMSGSAIADTAAIGSIMIPGLVEAGYEAEAAVALQASAGMVGVVIPPATALILFGFTAEISITQLFTAAIIPGLLVTLGLALTTVIVSWRNKRQRQRTPFHMASAGNATLRALPTLLIPLILFGGIFSGIFTPTEAGAVAILVALIITIVKRELHLPTVRDILDKAVDNIGIVMFILINATALGWAFTAGQIGESFKLFITSLTQDPLVTLLLMNAMIIIVHFFIETAPSILVMVPLLLPIALGLGISPLQFGIIFVVNSTIGQVAPPVGVNLFIASKIGNVSIARATPYIIPYLISSLIVLALVTLVPELSLGLGGLKR